jgi:hypothetical protein
MPAHSIPRSHGSKACFASGAQLVIRRTPPRRSLIRKARTLRPGAIQPLSQIRFSGFARSRIRIARAEQSPGDSKNHRERAVTDLASCLRVPPAARMPVDRRVSMSAMLTAAPPFCREGAQPR